MTIRLHGIAWRTAERGATLRSHYSEYEVRLDRCQAQQQQILNQLREMLTTSPHGLKPTLFN